jgi:hypothetical protein
MIKNKRIAACLTTLITLTFVLSATPTRADLNDWYNLGWRYGRQITVAEHAGKNRTDELIDVFAVFESGRCANASREIRVIASDNAEIPSQAYNVTMEGGYVRSCNVVFSANVSALGNQTYFLIYGNSQAQAPTYDGLRLHVEAAGDTYNITAVQGEIEKNYTRIFWKNLIDLYYNGTPAVWPGGPPGWEFSQVNIGSLWSDAWDTPWFGTGKSLSLVASGPLFVEFNYSEGYASDLLGTRFDFNTTTTSTVRICYQPNLFPLVKLQKTFNVDTNLANYTVKSPMYLDFKLANSTSQAIYENFTWKNLLGTVNSTASEVSCSDNIWSPANPAGWWSYNGSRTDSTDKPAACIGFIPENCASSVTDAECTAKITQQIEYDDHHCSQFLAGSYNATTDDYSKISASVVLYDLDAAAETAMDTLSATTRSPLTYSMEQAIIIPEFGDIWIPLSLIIAMASITILAHLARRRRRLH